MRFREDSPEELARARAAVAGWRSQHPTGTDQDMATVVGRQFHRDWAVVLRAVLFAAGRHRAREVTGIITGEAVAGRGR